MVRAAEGSDGEVNAVGTAVRALVEAPVGFEKALEGIGCGAAASARGAAGVGAEGAVAAWAGRERAQRSSSTSTTGRVWRLKVLPLPSLMGITVAR